MLAFTFGSQSAGTFSRNKSMGNSYRPQSLPQAGKTTLQSLKPRSPGGGRKSCCILRRTLLDGRMFSYVAHQKDKSWQPGPYPGVELMLLHKNEQTGGVTVLRKFAAGMTIPAHIHPLANELVYVLSGEWEESGVVYTTGAFFFAPRGSA